jgi:hypothetical protein
LWQGDALDVRVFNSGKTERRFSMSTWSRTLSVGGAAQHAWATRASGGWYDLTMRVCSRRPLPAPPGRASGDGPRFDHRPGHDGSGGDDSRVTRGSEAMIWPGRLNLSMRLAME